MTSCCLIVDRPKDAADGYERSDTSLKAVVANTWLRQLMMIPGISSVSYCSFMINELDSISLPTLQLMV